MIVAVILVAWFAVALTGALVLGRMLAVSEDRAGRVMYVDETAGRVPQLVH
jgi:hypothetical protein